jgi:hypothetical protein
MDDLEVIRLAVVDNIARKRIARDGMKVKGNFGEVGRSAQNALPDPAPEFTPVRKYSFPAETPVPLEECGGRGFRVIWTCPEGSKSKAFERFGNATSKGIVEDEKGG